MKAIVFKDTKNFSKAVRIIIDNHPDIDLVSDIIPAGDNTLIVLDEKYIECLKESGLTWEEENVENRA